MLKTHKSLKEQNAHLNKYILTLVKENEGLQGRLSDMKVTLQENKAMMQEFMTENQAKEVAAEKMAAEKANGV